jgi:DNA modification methylase
MSYRLADGIEFMKSLPDGSVDGIFTDPPWRMRGAYHAKKGFDRARGVQLVGGTNWLTLLKSMADEAARVLHPTSGRCFIWLGMTSLGPALKAIDALEYRSLFFVAWWPPRYMAGFEMLLDPIVYYAPAGAGWPMARKGKRRIRAIYQSSSRGEPDTVHPCARPYRNVVEILRDCFDEGEYVIDPFAGSDTTGVACRELNLKYDTCEVDPKMYTTGVHRHKQGGLFE